MIDTAAYDVGIPTGTAGLMVDMVERAAEVLSRVTGRLWAVDPLTALGHLLMPLMVGDEPPVATPPRPVTGGGFVHTDLIDDDRAFFAALVDGMPEGDAEQLALVAQQCRLPVTPYRSHHPAQHHPAQHAARTSTTLDRETGKTATIDLRSITVVDLTAMWAGPLCTMLLAACGATVITIEPHHRRDGLRGSPAQFEVLDRRKSRRALDLDSSEDRTEFEQLLTNADLLIESFSRRVMPNFGYDADGLRRINGRLGTVAVRAFPAASDECDWVAYGRGVHAASGLGVVRGRPSPAALAYPDPLAGVAAFTAAVELLGSAERGEPSEVALSTVIEPLRSGGERSIGTGDRRAVDRLRTAVGTSLDSPFTPASNAH